MDKAYALDATKGDSWASALNLTQFDLYGPGFSPPLDGELSVLLDGASSFLFSNCADPSSAVDEELVNLAWAANLRYCVHVVPSIQELRLYQTDDYSLRSRRFRTPNTIDGGAEFYSIIEGSNRRLEENVIRAVLTSYRMLRNDLSWRPEMNDAEIMKVFNLLLALRESAEKAGSSLVGIETLSEAIAFIRPLDLSYVDIPESSSSNELVIRDILLAMNVDDESRRPIKTHLLIRHASSELFQEAHLEIERVIQPQFSGMVDGEPQQGSLKKDIRFTPTNLARALTIQAFRTFSATNSLENDLEILDPACGSGIFLKEAVRELNRRGYTKTAKLRGFDISPISATMTKFVVGRECSDATFGFSTEIEAIDALEVNWGSPNLILMNPPFVQLENLDAGQKAHADSVLGDLAVGRYDLSMAFITKSVSSLAELGSVTSLLPASIMETRSGEGWREKLASESNIKLLARFQGFNIFRGSTIEVGVIGLEKSQNVSNSIATCLIAEQSREGAALRSLQSSHNVRGSGFDIFELPQASIFNSSWLPRSLKSLELKLQLLSFNLPKVGDLFEVRQGIRTGANSLLLVRTSDFESLPLAERKWFKQVAGQGVIVRGGIVRTEYVFYPHDDQGAELDTLEKIQSNVPTFFEKVLFPNKDVLLARARKNENNWWTLAEHRAWLLMPLPKLISTYFGSSGCFAFDPVGNLAVVQGFGWIWKQPQIQTQTQYDFFESEELIPGEVLLPELIPWERTRIPYAYVALLNSQFFQDVLAIYCPRVQGGQYDLSPRYVLAAPLPDLSDPVVMIADVVEKLCDFGELLANGESINADELEEYVQLAYGIRTGNGYK